MKKIFLLAAVSFATIGVASAKGKIPIGTVEKINVVYDLPNNADYAVSEGSDKYLDLATLHEEFTIANALPLWVTNEPRLVLTREGTDTYYDLTEEELNALLTENKIDKDDVDGLGFYTRFGGKLVLIGVIALLLVFNLGRRRK